MPRRNHRLLAAISRRGKLAIVAPTSHLAPKYLASTAVAPHCQAVSTGTKRNRLLHAWPMAACRLRAKMAMRAHDKQIAGFERRTGI